MPGWAARVRTLQRVAVGGGCNGVLRTSATRPSLWVRWRPGRSSSCSPALVVQAMAPFAHRHLAHPQSLGNLQVGLPSSQARMLGPPHQARGQPQGAGHGLQFLSPSPDQWNWGATNAHGPTPPMDGLPLYYLTFLQDDSLADSPTLIRNQREAEGRAGCRGCRRNVVCGWWSGPDQDCHPVGSGDRRRRRCWCRSFGVGCRRPVGR